MRGRLIAIGMLSAALLVAGVVLFVVRQPAPPAETSKPLDPPPPPKPTPTASPAPVTRAAPPPREPAGTRATPTPTVEAPPTTGTLRITSDVPDTSVFIDRVFLGTAPVTAPDLTPGTHRLNMSATGYEGIVETIEVAAGTHDLAIKFKEIKLDVKIEVVHKHAVGKCTGTLSATPQGLRYDTTEKNDAFVTPLTDLESFEVNYLEKNLKVKVKKGKTYNFTDPEGNADHLFVFHRDVEKARVRLARGDRGSGDADDDTAGVNGLCMSGPSSPEEQDPAQRPTFRGEAGVVLVDARAVDAAGRAVTGLTADDFEIRVDGLRRPIVSIEYQSAGPARVAAPGAALPTGSDSATQVSSVLVVVDRANLRPETSRGTLDAAAAFVERLPVSHAVGLLVLPEGKPSVDPGRDRPAVAQALRKMLGTYSPRTSLQDDELSERAALHRVIGQMSRLAGRRTVVFVTDRLGDSVSTVDLAQRAALSGVAFYVIATDAPVISAESRFASDLAVNEYDGLAGLATASGGAFLRRWAGADVVFGRVESELSGQYLLTFGIDPLAAPGRHKISVRVTRDGVDVRARREFVK